MSPTHMQLEVLMPFGVLTKKTGVLRIVAETLEGSFGILPRRLDCVAALSPGILTFETEEDGKVYLAVDEGVLIKTGRRVSVSVRRAVLGPDLAQLHGVVVKEFLSVDQNEREVRATMARLEVGFLHRLSDSQHE